MKQHGKFVLLTRLIENPNVVFYYKGNGSSVDALYTEIAMDKSEAKSFDSSTAQKLCAALNVDKQALKAHGYSKLEILMTGLPQFEEAN